ncbi:hypothetical protein [Fangia hongkongensis]|uniref:hypothetical protein n=1 Tax=Fangia hongkongensis TaxID=270495 RepID=UPI0003777060|nr:hypothetical protein [Fangia hongkongensis]MBK2125038.1 hypothetical protein [Fangia hongkongensis]
MQKLIYIPSYYSFSGKYIQSLLKFCSQNKLEFDLHVILNIKAACYVAEYREWLNAYEAQKWKTLLGSYANQATFDHTCAYFETVLDLLKPETVKYIVFDSCIKKHIMKLISIRETKSKVLHYNDFAFGYII